MFIDEFNPKVSIIIPCYNVEKYISECISSIIEQTYKNIEIIAVNDGSPDKSLEILKSFEYDKRFVLIDKKNGGVSSARNKGIEVSTGEYLIFVDGDDYLAPDFVDYMLKIVKSTKSDFCISKNCFTHIGEKQIKNDKIFKLSPKNATSLLLSSKVIVGSWNKIYKKSLLVDNNIEFDENLFYGEGLNLITTVSQIVDFVGVGNRKIYYYRRNNEHSATTKFNVLNIYNGEKALLNIKRNFRIKSKKLNQVHRYHMSLFYLGAITRLINNDLKNKHKREFYKWKWFIFKNSFTLFFNKYIPFKKILMLLFGSIFTGFVAMMDNKRRIKIQDNSV